MDDIKLLVTLDENYLPHLQVLLTSIHASNPGERMTLYLVHSGIPKEKLSTLDTQCALCGMELRPVTVDSELFEGAPVTKQYPQEMYYRLLAAQLLPKGLHRVLYLAGDKPPAPALGDRPRRQYLRRRVAQGQDRAGLGHKSGPPGDGEQILQLRRAAHRP